MSGVKTLFSGNFGHYRGERVEIRRRRAAFLVMRSKTGAEEKQPKLK